MNVRRGLFRIWLVASVLFVGVAVILLAQDIEREWQAYALHRQISGDSVVIPVMCGNARGEPGVDYATAPNQAPGPWDKFRTINQFATCYYPTVAAYLKVFPEKRGRSEDEVIKDAYVAAGETLYPRPHPIWGLLGVAAWLLAIPLLVLAIGSAIFWAFSGFRRDTPA